MPRGVPDALKQALAAADGYYSASTLELHLIDGTTLYLASDAVVIDGQSYAPHLRRTDTVKQSITASPDGVALSIQNVDRVIGATVTGARNLILGGRARFGRLYVVADAQYHIILFDGVVTDARAGELEMELRISSPLAAIGTPAGWRAIARNCQWRYRGVECGYAGSLPTCNKVYDHPQGCTGHDNTHRFGGFVFLQAPATNVSWVAPDDGSVGRAFDGSFGGGRLDPFDGHYRMPEILIVLIGPVWD